MKKLFLLGLATIVVTPVAFAISCGNSKKFDLPKDTSASQPQVSNAPITISNIPKNQNTISCALQAAITNVNEDGIYFWQPSYLNGKLWNGNTISSGKPLSAQETTKLIPMKQMTNTYSYDQVVELGEGDKFYMVFDNDDTDGLSFANFEKEFTFEDSSYSSTQLVDTLNEKMGNQVVKDYFKELRVGFANGQSNPYLGSQSNHVSGTWSEAMARLKSSVSAEIYQAIETYYQTASHVFFPEAINQGMFTYTKVTNRAYEITYHYEKMNPVTQAFFVLNNQNDQKAIKYPALSLGDQNEWIAYSNHQEAKYLALKDIFISNH